MKNKIGIQRNYHDEIRISTQKRTSQKQKGETKNRSEIIKSKSSLIEKKHTQHASDSLEWFKFIIFFLFVFPVLVLSLFFWFCHKSQHFVWTNKYKNTCVHKHTYNKNQVLNVFEKQWRIEEESEKNCRFLLDSDGESICALESAPNSKTFLNFLFHFFSNKKNWCTTDERGKRWWRNQFLEEKQKHNSTKKTKERRRNKRVIEKRTLLSSQVSGTVKVVQ